MRIFFGILLGLVIAMAIAFFAAQQVFGDLRDVGGRDKSKDVTQNLELSGFEEIEVEGVFELDVTVGGDFSVRISGAPETIGDLEATVENGALVLSQDDDIVIGRGKLGKQGMTAVITLPVLTEIEIAGVADGQVRGVDAEEFRADLAGVGDLVISGDCGRLDAQVSGVGELNARALECRDADIVVSGVGSASVYASESVDASVSGIGSIDIYGSPSQVDRQTSFLSSISVK